MRTSVEAPEVHLNKVTKLFVDAALLQELGVVQTKLALGVGEAKVSFPAWMGTPHESLHAVMQASLADHAARAAVQSLSLCGQKVEVSPLDFKLKYLAPAAGTSVRAEASVLRCSRGIAVMEVDVYSTGTGEETLLAVAEVTLVVPDDAVSLPKERCSCLGAALI